jgi:hypothetical protein
MRTKRRQGGGRMYNPRRPGDKTDFQVWKYFGGSYIMLQHKKEAGFRQIAPSLSCAAV